MEKYFQKEFESFISQDYKFAISEIAMIAELSGIKIYLIGGIVRDLILKTPVKDVDITVEGNAIEFCKNLEQKTDCKIIAVQENLRTAKVEFKSGVVIDFASTREEFYPEQGVLPVAKNFGCKLINDVKRRDFTINTLALELTGNEKFKLVDYFDGYSDIQNKKIKILHDKSFEDDASRIVRAIKFQMRLGFDIDEKTEKLMQNYLKNVNKTMPLERIKNELRQYFCISADNLYQNLTEKNVYKLISDNPIKNIDLSALEKIKQYFDFSNLWFIYIALMIVNSDFENPRLNLTANEKKILREVKELQALYPLKDENFEIYSALIEKTELSPVIYYVITRDNAVLKFYSALKQIKVLITGKDLIDLGFIPSPYFTKLFETVLKEKLSGNLQTKREELEFVKKFLDGCKN